MINLPLWILRNKFPSVYDSESGTAIEMVSKVYGAMQELIDEYNKFAENCNKQIAEFVETDAQSKEQFATAMSQQFQDFIDTVELKLKSYEYNRDEFVDTANTLLETLRQTNESFKEDLTGEFNTHKSAVDQRLQEYERDTEVSWNELTDKPFDAETVRGTLRQIYNGSPTWSGTKATITPSERLKFNTEYSIVIDDDITYNCKIGAEGVLGKVTFTYPDKFRFTEDGSNITFEMLDGTKPSKITITVIEETTVTKMLDPMFIPKEINVPWEYIINAPFGHHIQNAIYWDGKHDGMDVVAIHDGHYYKPTDFMCTFDDCLKGGFVNYGGSMGVSRTDFTSEHVYKLGEDAFFISTRDAVPIAFVTLVDNFTTNHKALFDATGVPYIGDLNSTYVDRQITFHEKGIYLSSTEPYWYADTFYINDYKFESYTPLPDELLGDVPEQIENLDERVTDLEENGGSGSAGDSMVKKLEFTTIEDFISWANENFDANTYLCKLPIIKIVATIGTDTAIFDNLNVSDGLVDGQYPVYLKKDVIYGIGQSGATHFYQEAYIGSTLILSTRMYTNGTSGYSEVSNTESRLTKEEFNAIGGKLVIYYLD